MKDAQGSILATANIASGASKDIIVDGGGTEILYTYPYDLLNTGQDVSYAVGDDKWVRDNIYAPEIATWGTDLVWSMPVLNPSDLTKLLRGSSPDGSGNNIFGNKERFTDTLGTQLYVEGIVIDSRLWCKNTFTTRQYREKFFRFNSI